MPATFDPVGDFAAVCDGLQAVTFTPAGGADQSITHALKRSVRRREADPSNGLYTSADVRWHLPIEEVTGEPVPGGTITEGSTEWTILTVDRDTLSDRWRCTCRNLVVTEQLNTVVTIEVASLAKGATGAHVETWSELLDDVRAKIQRMSATEKSEHGVRQLDRSYRAYMRERVDLRGKHRLVDSDGTVYLITGYRNPDRIDTLTEVDLSLWTEDAV